MEKHVIAAEKEFNEGEHITVQVAGREITVYNIEDEYYAYTNWCPHQSGPVCEGILSGTWDANLDKDSRNVELEWGREGKILNCPWHGWEFDVTTGKSLSQDVKLISHNVIVDEGDVVIEL